MEMNESAGTMSRLWLIDWETIRMQTQQLNMSRDADREDIVTGLSFGDFWCEACGCEWGAGMAALPAVAASMVHTCPQCGEVGVLPPYRELPRFVERVRLHWPS
jgi:hypothetical protein